MDFSVAATGVIEPKLCRASVVNDVISTQSPSIRNARAIKIPPPTTNGSMCETPFINCI